MRMTHRLWSSNPDLDFGELLAYTFKQVDNMKGHEESYEDEYPGDELFLKDLCKLVEYEEAIKHSDGSGKDQVDTRQPVACDRTKLSKPITDGSPRIRGHKAHKDRLSDT